MLGGSTLSNSNILLIGNTNPIISGNLTTHDVFIPDGNLTVEDGDVNITSSKKLVIKHSAGRDDLRLDSSSLTVYDSGRGVPDQTFNFKFMGSGNIARDLMVLDYTNSGMLNSRNYATPSPLRPNVEVRGDLKLQGAIRFADGYSLEGSGIQADLEYVSGIAVSNNNAVNGIFVEGYASGDISVATSFNSPSSGVVVNYNDDNTKYTLINRDKHTKIKANDYVIAIKINSEYRPIWVSNENSVCNCCTK